MHILSTYHQKIAILFWNSNTCQYLYIYRLLPVPESDGELNSEPVDDVTFVISAASLIEIISYFRESHSHIVI